MRRFWSRSTAFASLATAFTVLGVIAPASQARLAAPKLAAPATKASVQVLPAFAWNSVAHAAKYEFQLAADPKFASVVDNGSFQTVNRYATIDKSVADGTYYWRVRAISASDAAGKWATSRSLVKTWSQQPQLVTPANGATVTYPSTPLVLSWTPVTHAYKYLVTVSTDPGLSNPVASYLPVETSATSFALSTSLADGNTYYWSVTPEDGEKHRGRASATGSFRWSWPATVAGPRVRDPQSMQDTTTVFSPLLSWNGVAGAARYQVEINTSPTFASGSKVCCDDSVLGTSLSPTHTLPNVSYHAVGFYWRVRALDIDNHAGGWTTGPAFQEVFDPATPSVPNLRLTDNTYEPDGVTPHVLNPGSATSTGVPVIRWDPVQGASSYEVEMAPLEAQGCDYTTASFTELWDVRTATTAFTPLAAQASTQTPAGGSYSGIVGQDAAKNMQQSHTYCVRVRARSDRDANNHEVVSDWTQLGTTSDGTFTYQPIAPGSMRSPFTAVAGDYHGVGQVATMPALTWSPIPGAQSYWVVVARDQSLTDVIDLALTTVPAYAPRDGIGQPRSYPDQSNAFYWAVVPALNANGTGTAGSDTDDAPQPFQKSSAPPTLVAPSAGAAVSDQATFRWTPVAAARSYCLEVATDEHFHDIVQQGLGASGCPVGVTTDGTAFTSSSTYPSGTTLYWRVQGIDETGLGLNWSASGTFTHTLDAPVPSPSNPTATDGIPVLTWSPVNGATSYDMHVDQADGTTKDFSTRSTAFTPTGWYGSGVWRWQVRANFPKSVAGETNGPYTGLYAISRKISPPPNPVGSGRKGALLLTWDPSPVTIKQYRVEISTSSSFSTTVDQAMVDGTSWAPKLTGFAYQNGGTLYWRVASVDEGNNVGGYASGAFKLPRGLHVTASGVLSRRQKGAITVTVTTPSGSPVRSAKVSGSGAGARFGTRRTNRQGTVTVNVRPRRRGTVVIKVRRSGYTSATARVTVF